MGHVFYHRYFILRFVPSTPLSNPNEPSCLMRAMPSRMTEQNTGYYTMWNRDIWFVTEGPSVAHADIWLLEAIGLANLIQNEPTSG
jgi:hypothetical protein